MILAWVWERTTLENVDVGEVVRMPKGKEDSTYTVIEKFNDEDGNPKVRLEFNHASRRKYVHDPDKEVLVKRLDKETEEEAEEPFPSPSAEPSPFPREFTEARVPVRLVDMPVGVVYGLYNWIAPDSFGNKGRWTFTEIDEASGKVKELCITSKDGKEDMSGTPMTIGWVRGAMPHYIIDSVRTLTIGPKFGFKLPTSPIRDYTARHNIADMPIGTVFYDTGKALYLVISRTEGKKPKDASVVYVQIRDSEGRLTRAAENPYGRGIFRFDVTHDDCLDAYVDIELSKLYANKIGLPGLFYEASRIKPDKPEKETKTEEKPVETTERKPLTLMDYVKDQKITPAMLQKINEWRGKYGLPSNHPDRPKLRHFYFGPQQLNLLLATIFGGHHALLKGPAGSGKNTLVETVAFLLATPFREIQGHTHLDADAIIGHEVYRSEVRDVQDVVELDAELAAKGLDHSIRQAVLAAMTKKDEVTYLYGTVALAARDGAFVVIDEANTVRPEALIVTHSLRDERRRIEIPGYGAIEAHPRFRMVLTMNPGYAGTHELNKATADGFVPINVPALDEEEFKKLLLYRYDHRRLRETAAGYFAGLMQDMLRKSGSLGGSADISDRAVSTRAIFQTLDLIWEGVQPNLAAITCLVGRTDDPHEVNAITDIVNSRIPKRWGFADIYEGSGS